MTTDEAATLLKLSPRRVREFARGGRLPVARRIGGALIFRRSDVEALAKQPRPAGRPRARRPAREGEGDGA